MGYSWDIPLSPELDLNEYKTTGASPKLYLNEYSARTRPDRLRYPIDSLGSVKEFFFSILLSYISSNLKTKHMYNLHHSRSRFKLGTPVKVVMGAGLDSGRQGRVCKHFTPEDGYENYLKGKCWIPVEDSRGKFYMAANYLKVLSC